MAKTVEISFDGINRKLEQFQTWMNDYLSRVDTYGKIALGVIGLGFLLFIGGIVMLVI